MTTPALALSPLLRRLTLRRGFRTLRLRTLLLRLRPPLRLRLWTLLWLCALNRTWRLARLRGLALLLPVAELLLFVSLLFGPVLYGRGLPYQGM